MKTKWKYLFIYYQKHVLCISLWFWILKENKIFFGIFKKINQILKALINWLLNPNIYILNFHVRIVDHILYIFKTLGYVQIKTFNFVFLIIFVSF